VLTARDFHDFVEFTPHIGVKSTEAPNSPPFLTDAGSA
jgi:hypothetical protein